MRTYNDHESRTKHPINASYDSNRNKISIEDISININIFCFMGSGNLWLKGPFNLGARSYCRSLVYVPLHVKV